MVSLYEGDMLVIHFGWNLDPNCLTTVFNMALNLIDLYVKRKIYIQMEQHHVTCFHRIALYVMHSSRIDLYVMR
jgi:hypothetical protein